jgi:hypothetical protein
MQCGAEVGGSERRELGHVAAAAACASTCAQGDKRHQLQSQVGRPTTMTTVDTADQRSTWCNDALVVGVSTLDCMCKFGSDARCLWSAGNRCCAVHCMRCLAKVGLSRAARAADPLFMSVARV